MGTLFLMADEPSPTLFTPQALRFSSLSQDFTVLYDDMIVLRKSTPTARWFSDLPEVFVENGMGISQVDVPDSFDGITSEERTLLSSMGISTEEQGIKDHGLGIRQVVGPEVFVDIELIDEYSYEMHFYEPEARGNMVNGFHQVGSETPFVTWRIENPDASPDIYNRLRISEIRDGDTIVTEYDRAEEQNTWHLSKGNGLQVITRTEQENESGQIVTETVRDSSGDVASSTEKTYNTFAWGESIVEEIQDPDGAALTTTTTLPTTKAPMRRTPPLSEPGHTRTAHGSGIITTLPIV